VLLTHRGSKVQAVRKILAPLQAGQAAASPKGIAGHQAGTLR
jgi:hypothetical protein